MLSSMLGYSLIVLSTLSPNASAAPLDAIALDSSQISLQAPDHAAGPSPFPKTITCGPCELCTKKCSHTIHVPPSTVIPSVDYWVSCKTQVSYYCSKGVLECIHGSVFREDGSVYTKEPPVRGLGGRSVDTSSSTRALDTPTGPSGPLVVFHFYCDECLPNGKRKCFHTWGGFLQGTTRYTSVDYFLECSVRVPSWCTDKKFMTCLHARVYRKDGSVYNEEPPHRQKRRSVDISSLTPTLGASAAPFDSVAVDDSQKSLQTADPANGSAGPLAIYDIQCSQCHWDGKKRCIHSWGGLLKSRRESVDYLVDCDTPVVKFCRNENVMTCIKGRLYRDDGSVYDSEPPERPIAAFDALALSPDSPTPGYSEASGQAIANLAAGPPGQETVFEIRCGKCQPSKGKKTCYNAWGGRLKSAFRSVDYQIACSTKIDIYCSNEDVMKCIHGKVFDMQSRQIKGAPPQRYHRRSVDASSSVLTLDALDESETSAQRNSAFGLGRPENAYDITCGQCIHSKGMKMCWNGWGKRTSLGRQFQSVKYLVACSTKIDHKCVHDIVLKCIHGKIYNMKGVEEKGTPPQKFFKGRPGPGRATGALSSDV